MKVSHGKTIKYVVRGMYECVKTIFKRQRNNFQVK